MNVKFYSVVILFMATTLWANEHPKTGDRYCGPWGDEPNSPDTPSQHCFKLDEAHDKTGKKILILSDNMMLFHLPKSSPKVYVFEMNDQTLRIKRSLKDELWNISADGKSLTRQDKILSLQPKLRD